MTVTLGADAGQRRRSLSPLSTLPVLLIAGLTAIVLLAVSGRYGFFGDELYFVSAGRHLDWGYADQPPLLPLIALLMDTIAHGSLTVLRIPAILATSAGVVVSALVARELGGDGRAQVFTAACYTLAFSVSTTTLATPVFDMFLWTVLSWLLVRWVRGHSEGAADDRLLLMSGVVTALGMQVKFQIAVYVIALVLSILVVGPREMVRRPMMLAGAAIAVVATIPTLWWQAAHGWPQLEMSAAVAAEVRFVGPLLNGAGMLAGMGLGVGIVLGFYGWWRLFAAPELRAYRFFGCAAVAVVLFFVISSGRAYYINGLFPVLWAAGAVGFQRRRELKQVAGRRTWRWVAWPAFLLSLVPLASGLPLRPVESLSGKPFNVADFLYLGQIGWPGVAKTVEGVYRELPQRQRATTAIVTNDYWSASAIEYYAPELPRPYSGARGYWYFGRPPETATTVVHVGKLTPAMRKYFGDIRPVAVLDNGLDIATPMQGQPVFVATDRHASWSRIWPEMRRINLVN